ncbi:MAG TPA: multicopper oxidase family protein [Bryobacteraceae bacterium]|nr:multicopper oxidase family protein [Bryobacteraceae bacterium]
MNRRDFLGGLSAAALGGRAVFGTPQSHGSRPDQPETPEEKADFTVRIGRVDVELAPKKVIRTTGYNGTAPGPILRMREGRHVSIDVYNETDIPELVHWHGLNTSPEDDGSMEEGTPMVAPRSRRRYFFKAAPSGTRWYHTHTTAKRNLNRALYTGQFGFLYIEPASEPGDYDQEIFLAFKEWDAYFSTMGGDDSAEVAYKAFSVNGHSLGHGEPIRVKQGQRLLLHVLNASATLVRRIGFSGHSFEVRALDGNPVPRRAKVQALELGPAERVDAIVEMNRPGVWILGATRDGARAKGMGVVVEYAGRSGPPQWIAPPEQPWDYTAFGSAPNRPEPEERRVLVFEKKFAGRNWVDNWTVNGKSFPKTDAVRVQSGRRYRLVFDNRSDEAHPVHLHRHSFELAKVGAAATGGVVKDVVMLPPMAQVEADLLADNPGPTLFHCHNQTHMDYGFMAMFEYV